MSSETAAQGETTAAPGERTAGGETAARGERAAGGETAPRGETTPQREAGPAPHRAQQQVVLVRHGETEWSASGQHTSRTDLPLLDAGRERARALRDMLAERQFALVLCSPLRRARETCELAGFGQSAVMCQDLREWDYGEYEGLTTPQIREQRPGWFLWRDGCPGGESPGEVEARADSVLARVRQADGDVLLFAHGHILRVLGARWIGQPGAFGARLALRAGSLSTLGFERETEVLRGWNCT